MTMINFRTAVFAPAALILFAACASGGGTAAGPTVEPPQATQPPFAAGSTVAPAPGRAQAQAPSTPPDRSAPPPLGPVPQLRLPPMQEFTLSNGMRVLVMEKHDLPIAQVNIMLNAGSINEPAGKTSLASLTADMLDEGAGSRSALELSSAFEMLGARFGVGASLHGASVSLNVPFARLPDALNLVADVVQRPTFPAAELERLRKERVSGLIRARDVPGSIAQTLLTKTLFDPQHPYGRITNADALRGISIADVRSFYQTWWRPNNATAVVVGDITTAGAREMLERAFGGWPKADVQTRTIADAPQVQGRRIYIVDKPGSAQSVLILSRIGVPRSTADYYALEVMNTILGGSFTSRLNQNLRETHGYAYGAGSGFDYRLAAGPFTASANVQTQSTGPALMEFVKELRRIREDVTVEEVERAKNNLALGYPAGFQTVSGIAGQLGEIVTYKLPSDYFNQYIGKVLAVTKADVDRVAQRYVDPDNIAIIVVGDRTAIEQQVRQQNLGEIRFLTITDVLGPVPAS